MLVEKMLNQQWQVIVSIPQGREVDGDDIEAVKQIFAEPASLYLLRDDLVGGGDHTGINLDRHGTADAFELPFLKDPQQLLLCRKRHLPDLVEQDRALVRHFEATLALVDRAGERALLVAEELTLQKLSLIHISEPTRRTPISYAVFCL